MIQEWHGLLLTVPRKHAEQFDALKKLNDIIPFRKVATYRSLGIRVPVLVINTTGKGKRETFKGAKILKADFDEIGKLYALAYVYQNENEGGRVLRVNKNSPRVMVAGDYDDATIEHFNSLYKE